MYKKVRDKKIIIILVVVIFFSISGFEVARAEGIIERFTAGAIGWTIWTINSIIGFISGVFLMLANKLVEWALALNTNVIGQPVVMIGWNITLSFANLGFVLAIIVIAFATIFRIQSYAMKQILWKLIVAALLVNFSLVIAGAFINIADSVTSVLQEKSKLGPFSAANTFGDAFQPQKLLNTSIPGCYWVERVSIASSAGPCSKDEKGSTKRESTWSGGLFTEYTCECDIEKENLPSDIFGNDLTKGLLVGIASIFFTIISNLMMMITLLAVAFMFLIRFIVLGILLVLSPLVWLFWIFPGTSNLWQKWWNNFLRWTFFAPITMFFLYLAVQSTKGIPSITQGTEIESAIGDSFAQASVLQIVGNMVMIIGFIIGGLMVANSLSITGAKVAMGAAQGMAKGMGKGIARLPLRGGTAALNTSWGRKVGTALGGAGTTLTGKTGWYNAPTRLLGKGLKGVAGGITKGAATTYKGEGIWASTWGGMKAGSGLFKNKKQQLLEEVIAEERAKETPEKEKKKEAKKEENKEEKK